MCPQATPLMSGARQLPGFKDLVKVSQRMEYGSILKQEDLTGPTQSTRVWVADVDGDEKLDLLVGDNVTLVSPADGVSEEKFRRDYDDWMEKMQSMSSKLRDSSSDSAEREKVMAEYRSHYGKKAEFMNEQRTGFVWFYRQK